MANWRAKLTVREAMRLLEYACEHLAEASLKKPRRRDVTWLKWKLVAAVYREVEELAGKREATKP